MEIRVAGRAQDAGVPHLGCRCEVCERARGDPAERMYASSLVLDGAGDRHLVDATPDLRFQVPGDRLDGVFLTHAHLGHASGLLQFGTEALDADGLPVYCTDPVASFVEGNAPFRLLVERGQVDLVRTPPGEPVRVGDATVEPRAVEHRGITDTVAYLIEGDRSVLYMSDLDAWTPDAIALVAAADVALIDGTFFRKDELDRHGDVPHPAIVDSMERIDPAATETYFTHLNHTNPVLRPGSEARRAVRDRGFGIARRGATFEV